jgi:N-acetylmuramate 1-kinase
MDPRLQRALSRWELSNPQLLAGEAGARQYFRVAHGQLGSALVVLHPLDTDVMAGLSPDTTWGSTRGDAEGGKRPGGPPSFMSTQTDDSYFEFRALQAYLDPLLRVPTIIQSDDADRCLLVEDLGDTTLERRLVEHPEEESAWALRAGYLMATLAGPLTLGAPGHSFFMQRAFDQAELRMAWDACRISFFEEFLQKDPPRWLDRVMEEIHASLETRARFFTHCDFQTRNLMVHGDRLVVIDFQDARRGAATHDLASLLYDGYWDWSKEAGRILAGPLQHELGWNHDALQEELNLTGVQCNFKALGEFGYQLVHRHKGQFAPAIPRTLRHLRGHFQRMNHQDGVLAVEHMQRLAEERLLK